MAEEPQLDERNEEREKLMAALEVADTPPGEETPIKSEELASDASESEEPASTPDLEPEPEAEAEAEAEEEVPGEPSEKQTKRSRKSMSRLNKGWNELNDSKAEFKREREEFESQKQQHSDDQTSPEDYRTLAEQYKSDGEDDLATLAEEKAQEVEQRRQQKKYSEVIKGVETEWNSNLEDLQEQHPELLKESDLTHGVEKVLEQRPGLRGYPEGIQDAVTIAKSQLEANKFETLGKETVDLKAEIEELKQQTSVTGSPPGREAAPKGPSEGSQEQIKGKLLDALQAADDEGQGLRIFR